MIQILKPASEHSYRGCRVTAGPSGATCALITDGILVMSIVFADTLRILLTVGGHPLTALQQATRAVPIVFVGVIDPVGAGVVDSLARPGGNATGFTLYEFGLSGKWLELLKQIAPRVTRVGVLRDSTTTGGIGQFAALQGAAPSFGLELSPLDVRNEGEIERAVTAIAREPNGALIVTLS